METPQLPIRHSIAIEVEAPTRKQAAHLVRDLLNRLDAEDFAGDQSEIALNYHAGNIAETMTEASLHYSSHAAETLED
jgi:hypothetical protein